MPGSGTVGLLAAPVVVPAANSMSTLDAAARNRSRYELLQKSDDAGSRAVRIDAVTCEARVRTTAGGR